MEDRFVRGFIAGIIAGILTYIYGLVLSFSLQKLSKNIQGNI